MLVAISVVLTLFVHVKLYRPVPPLAVTLAEPVACPQAAAVMASGVMVGVIGGVKQSSADVLQP